MNEPKYKIGEKFQPPGMPELEVLRYETFNGNVHYGVCWYNEHKLEYGWVMCKLMDMVNVNSDALKADALRLDWIETEGRKHSCNINLDWGEGVTLRAAIDQVR